MKIGYPKRKLVFQPAIFRATLVSGRVVDLVKPQSCQSFEEFWPPTSPFGKIPLENIPTTWRYPGIHEVSMVEQGYNPKEKLKNPRKLTWIPKIAIFERRYILKTIIFGIYVRFRGVRRIQLISLAFLKKYNPFPCQPRICQPGWVRIG